MYGGAQSIVKVGRWYVYEGVLQKITPRFVQTRTVYLFNDCCVTANRILNTNFFQVGKLIPLGNAWIRDLADTPGTCFNENLRLRCSFISFCVVQMFSMRFSL